MTTIDALLDRLYTIKRDISALHKKEERLKADLHRVMNIQKVNQLAGTHFVATRTNRTRESLLKKEVPIEVWEQYAHTSRFPVMTIKKK